MASLGVDVPGQPQSLATRSWRWKTFPLSCGGGTWGTGLSCLCKVDQSTVWCPTCPQLGRVRVVGKAWGSTSQWFVLPQSMWHYLCFMVFFGEFKVATRIWHFCLLWKTFSTKHFKCHVQLISEEFEDHNQLRISEVDKICFHFIFSY